MGNKDQMQFEDEDLDSLDDFEDDVLPDVSSDDPLEAVDKVEPDMQEHVNARHEIERRNELKALKSELDEWDDLLDEDDL